MLLIRFWSLSTEPENILKYHPSLFLDYLSDQSKCQHSVISLTSNWGYLALFRFCFTFNLIAWITVFIVQNFNRRIILLLTNILTSVILWIGSLSVMKKVLLMFPFITLPLHFIILSRKWILIFLLLVFLLTMRLYMIFWYS